MRTTNILLSFLLLSAAGCTSDEQTDGPLANDKGEYAINFSGNLDMTLTKADPDPTVGKGVKATIYAYDNNTLITNGNYTAGDAGTFAGDDSYIMYLPKKSYNFYAVSANSTNDAAPTFAGGTSTADLENGVDYIYASNTSVAIPGTSDNNVQLSFSHKAVKIEITVKTAANSGIELVGWKGTVGGDNDNATITPPTATNCKMTLSNGSIAVATGVNTQSVANMTTTVVTGTSGPTNEKKATASYIMLPLAQKSPSASHELTVTLNAKVKIGNRTEEVKTYTAKLKAPDSGSYAFESGKEYKYTATLKPNEITFSGATVSGWTSGGAQDLTPTEP